LKQGLKRWVFGLLGKDPEAVVATFCSGPPELCRRMAEEVRRLVPDRRHFTVTRENWPELRGELRRYRIGLAPVMLSGEWDGLRLAAYRLAPRKILAYNSRLERHHLRLDLASLLFWLGVPLDRIFLRPRWWPFPKRDRSVMPRDYTLLDGRPCSPERRRVAVLSPYFPYPLSHGGVVRIYNLLREMAREFDIELFAFCDPGAVAASAPILEICARVAMVPRPRYREPRWSTLPPPEVMECRAPGMRRAIAEERRVFGFELLQVEYSQLAEFGGDVLVEHDVTFDLFGQVARERRTLGAWWDYYRWRRFEKRQTARYRRVVAMSPKDAELLGPGVRAEVIENGVDLARFQSQPERPGQRLLFIGSFQHFPNITAYRFFTERVWPLLRDKFPEMTLTVVGGSDHLIHWRAFTESPEPPPDERIRLLGFVEDVRPLYLEANLVIVPTTVSAGTNLKVLEAMAMRRAVVSTTSGCAGLGLLHSHSVWVADAPETFAAGVATLIADPERRRQIADAACQHAVRSFGWDAIGEKQRKMLRELLA
jgi:glycosyltransferase involved in cell wall biosynthesis